MDPYEFFYRRQKQMHPAMVTLKLVVTFFGVLLIAAVIGGLAMLALLAYGG